ncbi:MAG: hypothetical protein EOO92_07465 [Pedobacter sp.]|nr:MAG: hypothetical protein EOO92_07465 [Pedobacter sp.]
MRLLNLLRPAEGMAKKGIEKYVVMLIMAMVWFTAQRLVQFGDNTAAVIDQSIWMLILLSIISFLMVMGISWWLFNRFLFNMGLPAVGHLVLQFKDLQLWQQLGFYYASFALLVLAGVGALSAIV